MSDDMKEIGREPASSPLPSGAPYKRIELVRYADGSSAFGCAECAYVGPTSHKVRAHLSAHSRRRPRSPRPTRARSLLDALEVELLTLVGEADHWKVRALKAEGSLDAMRRALARD